MDTETFQKAKTVLFKCIKKNSYHINKDFIMEKLSNFPLFYKPDVKITNYQAFT